MEIKGSEVGLRDHGNDQLVSSSRPGYPTKPTGGFFLNLKSWDILGLGPSGMHRLPPSTSSQKAGNPAKPKNREFSSILPALQRLLHFRFGLRCQLKCPVNFMYLSDKTEYCRGSQGESPRKSVRRRKTLIFLMVILDWACECSTTL